MMIPYLSQPWFQFDGAKTPYSSWEESSTITMVYIIVIIMLKITMRSQQPYNIPIFLKNLHNFILATWSGLMWLGITLGLYERIINDNNSFYFMLCDTSTQPISGTLGFWLYIYFISKYYELLDTVLIVLTKKKLTVLHFWHHSIIGPMSLSWLYGAWSFCWIGAWLNTLIHVFMYGYYFLKAVFNYNPWWKRYITTGQILQFFIVFIMIWVYLFIALTEVPTTMTMKNVSIYNTTIQVPSLNVVKNACSGDVNVVVFSQAVNITFLILFINFYMQTYKKKQKKQ